MKPIKVLHFADAHIDIANYGRHDPETALPVRVMDFLSSLDQIVETAVSEQVDLVIFAGDAYKDRNPQPTFQREWGKRIMRLSKAGIPTVLLVGNHDMSPASGRAHTLQEFNTLAVEHVYVADRIGVLTPHDLGIPVQVITVPWVSRSKLMSREEMAGQSLQDVLTAMEERVTKAVLNAIENSDPDIPLILTAHASVSGAVFGSERAVMLGHELVLGGSLVSHNQLDYVALGHIHKHQALSKRGQHPPIVYPGSIERIDFGEAKEDKGFVIAEVAKGETFWDFIKLKTRRFLDYSVDVREADGFMQTIMAQLPAAEDVTDAVCRVKLIYPDNLEPILDENQIADRFEAAFSLQIQKRRLQTTRSRLGDTVAVESLTKEALLEKYWLTKQFDDEEITALQTLANEVFGNIEI